VNPLVTTIIYNRFLVVIYLQYWKYIFKDIQVICILLVENSWSYLLLWSHLEGVATIFDRRSLVIFFMYTSPLYQNDVQTHNFVGYIYYYYYNYQRLFCIQIETIICKSDPKRTIFHVYEFNLFAAWHRNYRSSLEIILVSPLSILSPFSFEYGFSFSLPRVTEILRPFTVDFMMDFCSFMFSNYKRFNLTEF